nr:unnamed protein product [Callosobruchus analis]CAI5854099.1 unnamed protein product [Callosobruchus analis]CAI5859518.1 unnamed protein product [Callosobruchus analis]CAI5869551.1 unnamed protein product [Callosobruchus analis]
MRYILIRKTLKALKLP